MNTPYSSFISESMLILTQLGISVAIKQHLNQSGEPMINEILNNEFKKRRTKNSRYSLRSYARDLQIHPSMLSRFLKGSRTPHSTTMLRILKLLDLDLSLKKQMVESIAGLGEFNIPTDAEYSELTSEQLQQLGDWTYSAILELLRARHRRFALDSAPIKIAKSLNRPRAEIEAKISQLLRLGLIKKTERGYQTLQQKQTAKSSRFLLDQIHRGYIEQMLSQMNRTREHERDISGTTLLIHPKRMAEAKERIKTFRRSLSKFLETKPDETTERLYRIQIGIFPLE